LLRSYLTVPVPDQFPDGRPDVRVVREPTHELDAVHLAQLTEITRQGDLEARHRQ
jgi:hypothetical protein